ncbi:hypothetical protein ACJMK2_025569 [Sinanodonta woodiana]|uniref:Heat shock 70 kDa protein 12A n=1 Tax=Sinanodonta woodiana TaxID=1069815 RepID=A0ABD3XGW6_SINWO
MASKLLVAAIDFGTTFSGWACSFSHEYEKEPTKVYVKQWTKGYLSQKAPTSVLIKPDGKTFEAFGYEAEDKYAELAEKEDHEKWYFFRRFKMHLHDVTSLNRNFEIKDETGKSVRAMTVFAMSISYLKEDLLRECNTRILDEISADDILWVLTVPAIWNESAKQFMREAAVEAGIQSNNLKIALEPECASIFCRLLKVEKTTDEEGLSLWKEGTIYMVLDAGGGTVDITVHKVLEGGKLQELHKASGGAWGGTQVDDAFKQFIIGIVGSRVYLNFFKRNMDDYLDFFREFEIKKRDVEPHSNSRFILRCPYSLKEMFENDSGEDLQDAVGHTKYANEIHFTKDKLKIEAVLMKQFFQKTMVSIIDFVRDLLATPMVMGITNILMVGGFAESKMLQDAIRNNFPDIKLIVPHEAGLSVLKGAVLYGHNPTAVTTRKARYTYGFETEDDFVEGYHDESKKRIEHQRHGPVILCSQMFRKNVQVGQDISADEEVCNGPFIPSDYEDLFFDLNIYASTNKSPKYVTDADCFKIGTMRVYPDDPSIPREERRYKIFMTYGGTEIKVRVVESNTGKTTNATIDFLA